MIPALCVHGHFYQPPREDPWTGEVPLEAGAEPYPNFNAKITAECYRPNADLGNFRRLSFDIGPTLARWLEDFEPAVLDAIVAQGRQALADSGAGPIAQAYNHTILPLATRRDRVTQVRWGIADFEHHYGRRPRGMWLPEAAVDLDTLRVLAENGIEFTILAPWQARHPGANPHQPHRVHLPDGLSIVVFFFDAGLSAAVSFDPSATADAGAFVAERLSTAGGENPQPPLTLIATDGELYGHHQPSRENFLHSLLFEEAERGERQLVGLGAYLDRFGVGSDAEIVERTAWSCHHGLDRWSIGCDCTPGDSGWKRVVREALAGLVESLDVAYEQAAAPFVQDPWALRDDYGRVLLGEQTVADLVLRHRARSLNESDVASVSRLLEGQYYGQCMQTSCGFFWEGLDRLEMRNNLAYAARAIQCNQSVTGRDLEGAFRQHLRDVQAERSGLSGEDIYLEESRSGGRAAGGS